MKNIIIDGKVKTICEECGEEIKSINHKCNIFHKRNNWELGKIHKAYGKVAMMRTIEGEPYRFFISKDKVVSMIPLSALENSSPTSQTKSLRDFPNGEHNISLKESSNEDSQIPKGTSLNNIIHRQSPNLKKCSKALSNTQ